VEQEELQLQVWAMSNLPVVPVLVEQPVPLEQAVAVVAVRVIQVRAVTEATLPAGPQARQTAVLVALDAGPGPQTRGLV
jgi:hypothetical protein